MAETNESFDCEFSPYDAPRIIVSGTPVSDPSPPFGETTARKVQYISPTKYVSQYELVSTSLHSFWCFLRCLLLSVVVGTVAIFLLTTLRSIWSSVSSAVEHVQAAVYGISYLGLGAMMLHGGQWRGPRSTVMTRY